MGKSPEDSVVNAYLQHWDAENLFVWVRVISRITAAVIPQARWAPGIPLRRGHPEVFQEGRKPRLAGKGAL